MKKEQRKLAAIMFTDMVGYSALMQKNEALVLELLEEQRRLLRPFFPQYGGREVETVGDAFFVEFASALQSAQCAFEIQKMLFERNAKVPPEKQILLRIGLHVGDVVHLGKHVHGDKVNIAARIEPLAEPGGICISEDMARQIQNQIDAPIVKLGRGELKNIQLPMGIYRIVMPWEKKRLAFTERLRFRLRQKRTRRFAVGVLTVLILVLFILGGLYIWQKAEEKKMVSLDKHRIAVLPFANLSADAENEYFSDGMTEELISRLSKVRSLEVIARTSVMKYKGKDKDIAEIGRELKVGTVLEGSVRKAENQIRISAQLINVQNQAHLWSEDYDRELKGVFAIQSDIAQRVTEALKVQLMAGEKQQIEKKGTENVETYNLYLKGRYHWYKMTKEGFQKAIEYFEQAIEKDPNYALAYAGLADSYLLLGWYSFLPPKEVFPKARAAAEKALEIDDTLAEAHAPLAVVRMIYDWDWLGAEKEFKRTLELNPNYALAHARYGMYLLYLGRHDESIAETKRALELDPLFLAINTNLGRMFYYARQYDRAIEQFRKTLEMDPNFWVAHNWLGTVYVDKGMYEESIAEFQKAIDLIGRDPWLISGLGYAYAMSGRRDEAQKVLDELKERAKQEHVPLSSIAFIYIGLGEKDQAFEWLQKVYEERSDDNLLYLKVDPWLDSLRSDPRFMELLKKVGLEK